MMVMTTSQKSKNNQKDIIQLKFLARVDFAFGARVTHRFVAISHAGHSNGHIFFIVQTVDYAVLFTQKKINNFSKTWIERT